MLELKVRGRLSFLTVKDWTSLDEAKELWAFLRRAYFTRI